jgi:hypothetical protein
MYDGHRSNMKKGSLKVNNRISDHLNTETIKVKHTFIKVIKQNFFSNK